MAERRPLAAAVNSYANADPDQVRAFITQEPRREPEQAAAGTDRLGTAEKERGQAAPIRKPASTRNTKKKPTRLQPVGLIPVTVRLRPEIAGALKRASLERQLAGEETFTQQELVESALEPWLIEEGYISSEA